MRKLISLLLILLMVSLLAISCNVSDKEKEDGSSQSCGLNNVVDDKQSQTQETNDEATSEEPTAETTIDYTDKTLPFHRYDSLDLEQELASDIKKAYARYMAKKSANLVLTDIYVYLYYNIDGTHIVNFEYAYEQIVRVSTVAGYKISYPNGRMYYVYHDNEVYTIEEAYEKGYITKEIIYNFAKKVANKIEEV